MRRRVHRLIAVVGIGALLAGAAACGSGRGDDAGGGSDSTTAPAADQVEQFGDLPSPCGPGQPSGTPDRAVDATSVTIGYGDDAGFQGNPGSNHQMSDAVRALIDWCNAQGGINGREVKGIY